MELQKNTVKRVATILKWTYGIVPILAGLDKFSNLLTDWTIYLAEIIIEPVPLTAQNFMHIVGVVEILAGILVFAKPKMGALVVSLWLLAIVINLVLTGQYFDIAVRDLVMAIGAFSLFLLAGPKKTTI